MSPQFISKDKSIEKKIKNIWGPGKSFTFGKELMSTVRDSEKKLKEINQDKNFISTINYSNNNLNGKICINNLISINNCTSNDNYERSKEIDKINNYNTNNNNILKNKLKENKNISETDKNNIRKKIVLKGNIFKNGIITIDENGYYSGFRHKLDGHVYFGLGELFDEFGNNMNDSIIKLRGYDPNYDKKETVRFIEIVYDKLMHKYIIYFLNPELSLSIQIKDSFYIENFKPLLFIFGRIPATIKTSNLNNQLIIEISVYLQNKVYKYSFVQYISTITIGRCNSNVLIDNISVSKNHAFIYFNADENKFIIKDNSSTNKTYLVLHAGDRYIIDKDTECKCLTNKFSIHIE